MAQNKETREVQSPAFLAVGRDPDVLILRQQSGLLYTRNGVPVRVGVPGLADAMMAVRVTITPEMVGRTVALAAFAEFKTATGRASQDQRRFASACASRGIPYRLIRSAEEMVQFVEELRSGR
jgi:hypothetical protein